MSLVKQGKYGYPLILSGFSGTKQHALPHLSPFSRWERVVWFSQLGVRAKNRYIKKALCPIHSIMVQNQFPN